MSIDNADPFWRGKRVLVTGSTRGIGEATARHFVSLGARVVLHGTDAPRGAALATELHAVGGPDCAYFVAADLYDADSPARLVAATVADLGGLDVLVNNAGANHFYGTTETSLEQWQRCIDLDVRAAWLLAIEAAKVMATPGAIVNVSSNHASATMPGIFPYNVAKAAMGALTQSLALELAPRGIRVNTVTPGYIDTPINVTYFNTFPDADAERARVERLHPLGRIGLPDDVARAIAFLASQRDAGFITGTNLLIDGGRSALMQDPSTQP